jgi:hypothetical protein
MTPPEPPPAVVAPPQIGIQINGADANSQAGLAARDLKHAVAALDSIRLWSEQYTPEELEALGLPVGTGDEYKSAMGEVPAIVAALAATVFLKKLWGTGV